MRPPTDGEAFSAAEEEFFREGDAMSGNDAVEITHEEAVTVAPQRRTWLQWFARAPRAVSEPAFAGNDNTKL